MHTIRTALAAILCLVFAGAPLTAQQVIDSAYKGKVLVRLVAHQDSAFHYAAYVPRRYTGDHAVPLLLVLDPSGRAVLGAQLMAPAAERLDWVVMSSYDTRGAVTNASNEKAVNLMLDDAFSAFNIDTARIYLAGLSGTARDSWVFAYGSGGHVAGILSAGASMPGDTAWRRKYGGRPPFDVAMTAGDQDFDLDEVQTTADTLRALGDPVRADEFVGGQQWAPQPVVWQALGWLEARAMARRLRPMDSLFVDSLFAVDSTRASALAGTSRTGAAYDAWANIAGAWKGLHDVAFAEARRAALAADPVVRRWLTERDSLRAATGPARRAMAATLTALRRRPGVPDLRRLTDDLRIVQYRTWAADARDSLRAAWAARRLGDLYVQVSRFEPEVYIRAGDASRALAMLGIAEEIRQHDPIVCRERARAYALRRDADAALTNLRCALAGHAITIPEIRTDPRFAFMRSLDEYDQLVNPPGGG